MIVHNCVQTSAEWWELRRGLPTASEFSRIMTPAKRVYSGAAPKYQDQLLSEHLSLEPNYYSKFGPHNPNIEHGKETERAARDWYELTTGHTVRQVGFITDDDGFFGCSPDGLIANAGTIETAIDPAVLASEYAGGLELKCPRLDTHLGWLRQPDRIPRDHQCQVYGSLLISGLPWWDFMSYAVGAEPLVVRATIEDDFLIYLAGCCLRFKAEYELILAKHCPDWRERKARNLLAFRVEKVDYDQPYEYGTEPADEGRYVPEF